MEVKELKQKNKKELETLLGEQREKLRNLRFELQSKSLKKVHGIKETRRNIARLLMFLGQAK